MIENQKSVEGIVGILSKFKDQDLFSLASTVTQGLLKNKLESREDAIEAILKYSPDEESFLKRKAVTRDNLFYYLHDTGADVSLPITKDKLIDKVLTIWYEDDQVAIPNANQIQTQETVTLQPRTPQSEQNTVQLNLSEIDVMAAKFTEWFYNMMNQNEYIGTEHFFPDSSLLIKLINGSQQSADEVRANTEELVKLLFNTKQQFNLYFNPNITKDGVGGKMDPHGLVIIMACGTLHVNNIVSGVFEQIFALARDPLSENNWKIKNTQLTLRSDSGVSAVPRLCDMELPHALQITET